MQLEIGFTYAEQQAFNGHNLLPGLSGPHCKFVLMLNDLELGASEKTHSRNGWGCSRADANHLTGTQFGTTFPLVRLCVKALDLRSCDSIDSSDGRAELFRLDGIRSTGPVRVGFGSSVRQSSSRDA